MLVRELIEELRKLEPESEVMISTGPWEADTFVVASVYDGGSDDGDYGTTFIDVLPLPPYEHA